MPVLRITTAQNVEVNYRLATVMDRLVGGLIDLAAQVVYILITMMLLVPLTIRTGGGAWIILLFIPVILYSLLFDTLFNGRSLGKLIMGTKVIRIDQTRAGFTSYFIRWVLRIIDVYYTMGVLAIGFIFFNKKAQRLGDVLGKTAVVKVKPAVQYHTMMRYVPNNYEVVYPDVDKLSQDDVMAIDELLQYYMRLGISFRINELIYKAKEKVEKIIGRKIEQNAHKFLQCVVTDYVAIQNRKQQENAEALNLVPGMKASL